MSHPAKMMLPFLGMFVLALVVTNTISRYTSAESASVPNLGDLRSVAIVEVHGAQGAVLNGEFKKIPKPDGSFELLARLTGTGVKDGGTVEVEIPAPGDVDQRQELEVELQGLSPNDSYTIHIDGRGVIPVTTDGRGAVDVEVKAAPGR